MAKYRCALPQLSEDLFLTDGGIETTLIFHEKLDLPFFAAFDLLKDEKGTNALRKYFRTYAAMAKSHKTGFILESATWRASLDWGRKLGYDKETLAALNRKAIALLEEVRKEFETPQTKIVISGCIGPRGDGYQIGELMSVDEAKDYHAFQARTFAASNADMICAITMTNAEEAMGLTIAAKEAEMPVAVSFTVETDGRLPSGQSLKEAITQVDRGTKSTPVYYMISCAHPAHFEGVLKSFEPWTGRIRGLRANASRKSHAELNESEVLDEGNPEELGQDYKKLKNRLPQLNVVGGCCGTDHRHVEAISKALSRQT